MAANIETMEHWSAAPDPRMRKAKSEMEEELLIKLGAKKEVIEFHPLILSSRPERGKPFVNLNYSRTIPPVREAPSKNKSPWDNKDQALRQMSNSSRRGPRDFILPNLVKPPCPVKTMVVPELDEEYFVRRHAATLRLSQLLGEWTVYESLAYPRPISRALTLSEAAGLTRKLSHGSLAQVAKGQPRRLSADSFASSDSDSSGRGGSKRKPLRPVPRSRRTKNRWQDMAGEAMLHLKACRMRLPADLPRSELRIYVSSTPDLKEEREFLEEVAYPKLREFCEKLGLNCHVVDMRNGAGILDNSVETFDLIEKELRTCRSLSIGPYFVSVMGHAMVEPGLPGFFHKPVYEQIREILLREDIIGVEAFDDVYRLDSNRTPPVYVKQKITAFEEYQSPEEVERILLNALKEAVRVISKTSADNTSSSVDFYKWSALVKEHEEGLLTSYSPRSDTLCFMMDAADAEKDPGSQAPPILRLRHAVYRHYRNFASISNLVSFKSGKKTVAFLRSISDTFLAGVASLLKAQIRHRDYSLTQQLTEGSEALQHVRLAFSRTHEALDNSHAVAQVRTVLEAEGAQPRAVVLLGPTGTGKSTIASQVARGSVLWEPRRKVVTRCLGTTLRSSTLYRVLGSINKQLSFIYNSHAVSPVDASLQQVVSTFCRTLQSVPEKKHLAGDLLLILDQLDSLPDLEARFLLTILNSLPEGVTLLFTITTPNDIANAITSHPLVTAVYRTHMIGREIGKYVRESLADVKRVATDDQIKTAITTLPNDPRPVYAQMVSHITRWWPSATLPDLNTCTGDPDKDLATFIESVESGLGKAFSRYALSLLSAARHGLADQEILHLLSKDADLLNEIEEEENDRVSVVEGFPYQLQLSNLIERLGQFLTNIKIEGESVYQINCQSLKTAIKTRYMSDNFFHIIHLRLANFFQFIRRGLLLSSRDISEQKHQQMSKYHWRTMRCVPYHLCHSSADTGEVWRQLKERVFFNFAWLINAVYSGFLPDLLDDIAYALENVSLDPDILYLQQLLLQTRRTIVHNPLSMAAVFSSQNPEDSEHAVRDSVRAIIHEARQWLTQVHLQALVPVNYTSDKSSRLLVKGKSLFGVTSFQPVPDNDDTGGSLLLQRGSVLTVLNMLTREEMPLATLRGEVVSVKVVKGGFVMAMTAGTPEPYSVDIYSLFRGKHLKSAPIREDKLLWFDMRSPNVVYFATEKGIKCLDVERASVANVLTANKQWDASMISSSKPERIITLTRGDKVEIRQIHVKDFSNIKSIRLKVEPANKYCQPLMTTKDGRFIIYVTERQAEVIETLDFRRSEVLSYHDLPIVKAEFSRSHEHVFLAYANGVVTGHVLVSGLEALTVKIQPSPRPQKIKPAKSVVRVAQRISDSASVETITAMVTSEDDHFLMLGTSLGQVYVFHMPTGLQMVDITTGQASITNLTFLTDKGHFQHLMTADGTGKALHWNLRPLFAQTRRLVLPYISDPDMLREEEPKIDLSTYHVFYQARHDNRIFLNGPDVAAFYMKLPEGIFAELADLDPAFGEQFDWEVKGTIADLNDHLLALVCGQELGDTILTISRDYRLGQWSLHDGKLLWCRQLPGNDAGTEGRGTGIHDLALVYWDQAVLVAQESRTGSGYEVSVIFTGEGKKKSLSRDNVQCYCVSTDRSQVMLQCFAHANHAETFLCKWDLVGCREVRCEEEHASQKHVMRHRRDARSVFTIFSSTLQLKASFEMAALPGTPKAPILADAHKYSRLTVARRDEEPEMSPRVLNGHVKARSRAGLINDASNRGEPQGFLEQSQHEADPGLSDTVLSTSQTPVPAGSNGGPALRVTQPTEASLEISPQTADEGIPNADLLSAENRVNLDTSLGNEQQPEMTNTSEAEEQSSSPRLGHIITKLKWTKVRSKPETPELVSRSSRLTPSTGLQVAASRQSSARSNRGNSISSRGATPTGNPDKVQATASKPKNSPEAMQSPRQEPGVQTIPDIQEEEGGEEKHSPCGEETETGDPGVSHGSCSISTAVTAACFIGEESLALGTNTGHIMCLPLPEMEPIVGWGEAGPRVTESVLPNFLLEVGAPHDGPVVFLTTSDDAATLVTTSGSAVCLWNVKQRALTMRVCLDKGQEVSQLVISKDASIFAVATTARILRLWTPLEQREVASYQTAFDIADLQMTSDCHKVIVRGVGREGKPVLEVFEVRNVDAILMQVPSRKVSREVERNNSLVQERESMRTGESRRKSERRRSSAGTDIASGSTKN